MLVRINILNDVVIAFIIYLYNKGIIKLASNLWISQ